jgi:hypothetical protein
MSTANVRSIEAVRDFRVALLMFQQSVSDALTSMQEQVYSALEWMENDRPRHWHQQELKAFDQISEARIALEGARMRKSMDDYRPSLIEEKEATRDAKDRLAYCQEKMRIVKAMCIKVRHEADEFRGRMSQLECLLETDLPKMVALLERMLTALESYAEVDTHKYED